MLQENVSLKKKVAPWLFCLWIWICSNAEAHRLHFVRIFFKKLEQIDFFAQIFLCPCALKHKEKGWSLLFTHWLFT